MIKLLEQLTPEEALQAARVAAEDYYRHEISTLHPHEDQGCFSSTFTVQYADQKKAIIQLRNGRLDTSLIALARGLLGDIVPSVRVVKSSQTMWAFGMPFIPGARWEPLILTCLKDDVAITMEYGSILAKCRLTATARASEAIVEHQIIPRLKEIMQNDIPTLENDYPFLRTRLESLLPRAHNLKQLPLALTHIDPNPFNVLIDDSSPPRIVGLIDWECATILPFGMNAYQIRLIAVINRKRVDYPDPAAAVPIAMAFWNSFTKDIEQELKGAVLDAMCIGLILFGEFFEGSGTPSKDMLQNTVARLDWLEELYRPLCTLHHDEGGKIVTVLPAG